MFCSQCGASHPGGARFCASCGSSLAIPVSASNRLAVDVAPGAAPPSKAMSPAAVPRTPSAEATRPDPSAGESGPSAWLVGPISGFVGGLAGWGSCFLISFAVHDPVYCLPLGLAVLGVTVFVAGRKAVRNRQRLLQITAVGCALLVAALATSLLTGWIGTALEALVIGVFGALVGLLLPALVPRRARSSQEPAMAYGYAAVMGPVAGSGPPLVMSPSGTPVFVAAPGSTNGFAVAALVFGILGGSVLSITFGFVALSQVRRSGGLQRGRGMAIAGIVLGFVWLGLSIAFFVLLFGASSTAWRT